VNALPAVETRVQTVEVQDALEGGAKASLEIIVPDRTSVQEDLTPRGRSNAKVQAGAMTGGRQNLLK